MTTKLYGISASYRTKKIIIAAAYANVELAVEEFFPRGQPEDVIKEFTKKNPNVKIPTLETPEGCIFESNAILRYVARKSTGAKLYGATKFETAQIDQHLDWASTLLEPALFQFTGVHFGHLQYDASTYQSKREALLKALTLLEGILGNKQFIVGSSISIADILIVSDLIVFYRYFADESVRAQLPNLSKYVERIANEQNFTKFGGRFVLCKTALKPYEGILPVAQPEESKKQEKKPAAPKEKKEAAPAQKKAAKKKDDDEEEDEPAEKKEKNALDALPPSPFNLFDFKTLFVNHPNKKEALEEFWKLYDDQGYSVWRMDYDKAEGEGAVLHYTANLMNGFLQRLETFRKYAFGIVGIYGDEPNLEIRGCWVWRGTEIPFEIKDHPSGEWYRFRKLDVKNNADDKKIQEEYWCNWNCDVDKVEGLTVRDVKYYK